MKKVTLFVGSILLLSPLEAAPVATTTRAITFAGQSVTAQVSPARTPGYYRLIYDVSTKKIKALVHSVGVTETVNGLYCADEYAEIQAFAEAHGLTGLPKLANGRG